MTVNTLAGTQPDGTLGGPINPSTDTRQGTLTPLAPGVTRIDHLGYEIWQDSIGLTSSTADTLGTLQFLGAFRGWRIDRDAQGNFPTLAGLGLGSTLWPDVDVSNIGGTFNEASQPSPLPPGTTTITDGPLNDAFSASGSGGVALAGGDLGAYFDQVVVPLIDPLSDSFVYLEAAGFGINNSLDPVFGDTNGYDIVLIAQSAPVPEPATAALLLFAAAALFTRRPR